MQQVFHKPYMIVNNRINVITKKKKKKKIINTLYFTQKAKHNIQTI